MEADRSEEPRHERPLRPSPSNRNRHGARRLEWEKGRTAFERLAPRLSKDLSGKYVAISGGKVVGKDADYERLYWRVLKKIPRAVFFIGRVRGPQPVVEVSV